MIPTTPARLDPTRATLPPEPLGFEFRQVGLRAMNEAKRRYPGPAGLILARAIEDHLGFGYRTDHQSPVPQLIAELTA